MTRCQIQSYTRQHAHLHVTDHSSAASQGRPGALIEVIRRHHASVRHLETGVHINAPRHHHSPMGFYDLDSTWNNQVVSNLPEETNKQAEVESALRPHMQ